MIDINELLKENVISFHSLGGLRKLLPLPDYIGGIKEWEKTKQVEPLDARKPVSKSKILLERFERNIRGTMLITTQAGVDLIRQHPAQRLPPMHECKYQYEPWEYGLPIIPNFVFADQPVNMQAYGTGFLIKRCKDQTKGYLVTAGHIADLICGPGKQVRAGMRCISGFAVEVEEEKEDQALDKVLQDWSVSCEIKELVAGEYSKIDGTDWAVFSIEVVRHESNSMTLPEPLPLNDPACGEAVCCLGYPLGLPLKLTWDGVLYKQGKQNFYCKLSSYAGNSGSPVFNEDLDVVGIISGPELEHVFIIDIPKYGGLYFCPKVYLYGSHGLRCSNVGAVQYCLDIQCPDF